MSEASGTRRLLSEPFVTLCGRFCSPFEIIPPIKGMAMTRTITAAASNSAHAFPLIFRKPRDHKLSANQKDSDGQWNYGRCLEKGRGTPMELCEAARCFKPLTDQGSSFA
jgi:hypothetical protein